MLTTKKLTLAGAGAALMALCALSLAPAALASTYTSAPAAVVIYPTILVDTLSCSGPGCDPNYATDTVVTLTTAKDDPNDPITAAHCFYVNANKRCSNTGLVCVTSDDCVSSGFTGSCAPGWVEIDFDVMLTPEQPVAWTASGGLSATQVPCPGGLNNVHCPGATCSTSPFQACVTSAQCNAGGTCSAVSNAGTRVPPVGEEPFVGELKCVEVDGDTRLPAVCDESAAPFCPKNLEGTATITSVNLGTTDLDTGRYNAVGLRPIGSNDGNNTLVIGGAAAEYQGCAQVLVFNFLFDGAFDPMSDSTTVPPTADLRSFTDLTLVPCTEDFLTQTPTTVTAQYLVYNEFEQRFSTSRPVDCYFMKQISLIDTTQEERSIFNVNVSGTVGGQARITGIGGGLIGQASLSMCSDTGCDVTQTHADYELNGFGTRDEADFIYMP